jgi:hypothetical protein
MAAAMKNAIFKLKLGYVRMGGGYIKTSTI